MKELQLKVVSNQQIANEIYEMQFERPKNLTFKSGQFINLSTKNSQHLLRRPFAIADFNDKNFSICYQIKGSGTQSLTKIEAGENISALLPLGNFFEVKKEYKKIAIVGGGVGVFPLLACLREYGKTNQIHSYIGFRAKPYICKVEEFKELSTKAQFVTDDGSFVAKGNVVDIFMKDCQKEKFDAIFACGPTPMLKALKEQYIKAGLNMPCFVSLEERMGCGVGACLVCVCKSANADKNFRVCKDGPIFEITEVNL